MLLLLMSFIYFAGKFREHDQRNTALKVSQFPSLFQEFNLSVLEECVSLGAFRTLLRYNRDKDNERAASPTEPSLDPLFQAAQLTMFRHINNVINHLPVPHQCLAFSTVLPSRALRYMERIDDLFTDHGWFDMNFSLAAAFAQYVVCIRRFPWEARVPGESRADVCRFCVLLMEVRTKIA